LPWGLARFYPTEPLLIECRPLAQKRFSTAGATVMRASSGHRAIRRFSASS
jgi:hypothetical protein